MKNKLTLEEDLNYQDQQFILNIVSNMIKSEWETVEQYNSLLATITSMGQSNYNLISDTADIVQVVNDIVKEEYIHIGQLEKLVQSKIPASAHIEDGKFEAAVETQEVVPVQPQVEQPLQDMVVAQPEVTVEEDVPLKPVRKKLVLLDLPD